MADVKIPVSATVKGVTDELNKIPPAVEQTAKRIAKFKWSPVDLKAVDGDLKKLEQLIADFHKRVAQMGINVGPAMPGGGAVIPGAATPTAPARPVPGAPPSTPTTRRSGPGAYTHAPMWHQVGTSLISGVGGGFGQIGSFGARGMIAGTRDGGMFGGVGGLLRGLGVGAAAFGAFKVGQGVSEGYELAKERGGALDALKRQMGDLGVSFERLKAMSEGAADGLGVNSREAAELAKEFNRLSRGSDGTPEGLMRSVRVGLGLDRAYGLADGTGGRFLAGMRNIDPRQNNRELALLLAETIGRSGMNARVDEVMQAMQSFATTTSRMSLVSPNLSAYGGAFSSLMRMPGMTSENATGILGQANASMMRMGGRGEAGQNFILTALSRGGMLDPIQAMALAQGGLFGTRGSIFGNSALTGWVGNPGGRQDITNFELVRDQMRSMGGPRGLQLEGLMGLFGLSSLASTAALMDMDTSGIGRLKGALEKAGVDINTLNPTGIQALAKLGPNASVEQLRAAAAAGREETEFSRMLDSLKKLDDIKTNTGDRLIGPINTMRDALVAIAGKLAPDSMFVKAQKQVGAELVSSVGDRKAALENELSGRLSVTSSYFNRLPADRQAEIRRKRAAAEAELATLRPRLDSMKSGMTPELLARLAETDSLLGMPIGTSARQIAKESAFNPKAVSKAGAMGLAQVMPKTLASLEKRFGRKLDPYDPNDAVLMHRELMRENLEKFGNIPDALKAYNGGWDPKKWGNAETRSYPDGIVTPLPAEHARQSAAAGSNRTLSAQSIEAALVLHPQDAGGRTMGPPVQTRVRVPLGSGVMQ